MVASVYTVRKGSQVHRFGRVDQNARCLRRMTYAWQWQWHYITLHYSSNT